MPFLKIYIDTYIHTHTQQYAKWIYLTGHQFPHVQNEKVFARELLGRLNNTCLSEPTYIVNSQEVVLMFLIFYYKCLEVLKNYWLWIQTEY